MTNHDDHRTATTLSPVSLHLPRNDVDNDISRRNADESVRGTNKESREIEEEDLTRSSKNRAEEIGDDSWLRQASENKAKSRSPSGDDGITLEERTLVTNAIRQDENERERSSTRIYPRPTTVRGIPLARLIASSRTRVTRGFYVTRSENDIPATPTLIPASDFTLPHPTSYPSTEQQRTETTLIFDVSTTDDDDDDDDVVVIANENGPEETIRSTTPNNNSSSILNDDRIEDDLSISTSSVLSLQNSNIAEKLSDYRQINAVETLAAAASKRGKSPRDFDHDTEAPHNTRIVSSTTRRTSTRPPTSRYKEVTAPLWTGKRIAARKRNRNTLSPIEEVVPRQTESDLTLSAANASATFVISSTSTSTSMPMPTTRQLSTTLGTPESAAAASEASNVHTDFTDFTDRPVENLEKRTITEATISVTDAITNFPISELTTLNDESNDATRVVTCSAAPADGATIVTMTAIANASAARVTASSAVESQVAGAFAATTDAVITTAPSATSGCAAIETAPEIAALPIAARINSVADEYPITTIPGTTAASAVEIATVPVLANYSLITTSPYEFATDYAIETAAETTSTVKAAYVTANYPALAVAAIAQATDTRATTIIPTFPTLPLTATIVSATDKRTVNTIPVNRFATTAATTRDLVSTANIVATDTTSTITLATIINPTTVYPNVTVSLPNANVSLAITPAAADTLPTTLPPTEIDSEPLEITSETPPVTDTTLHGLVVPDRVVPSSESAPSTIVQLSDALDIDDKVVDGSTVSDVATATVLLSIGTTEPAMTFEASPVTASSRLPSRGIDIANTTISTVTSTSITATFPAQTGDYVDEQGLATSMDSRTSLPTLSSSAIPTADTATYRPSITGLWLDSAQTTDQTTRKTTLLTALTAQMNAERDFKRASTSTIARDRTESRKRIVDINETNPSQTANEEGNGTPETRNRKAKGDGAVSRDTTEDGMENRTASQFDTNNYTITFGRNTPRRRVLNRTNNWSGGSLSAHRSIGHYSPRRVTSAYQHRGRPRRPSHHLSSSPRTIEENRTEGRLGINPEAISSTVRPDISEERAVRDPPRNLTRVDTKVLSQRIGEKIVEENAAVSPVRGTYTTVFVRSSTYTGDKTPRGRQVVPRRWRSRPRSEEDSMNERRSDAPSDSADEILSDGSQGNPRASEASNSERRHGTGRMRLVLKSVRSRPEERNVTERTSVDSDRAGKGLRNDPLSDLYTGDDPSDEGNATERMRIVSKSVGSKSNERNVAIDEANGNIRFHSADVLHPTRDDPASNSHTSENPGAKVKTRRRVRVISKRVKAKINEERTTAERIDASTGLLADDQSLQSPPRTAEGTRVVMKIVQSNKSETNSTRETSKHLLDEEDAREQTAVVKSDNVAKSKFVERDSLAEETSRDLDFAVNELRVIVPFNFSNNLYASETNFSVRDNSSNNLRMDDLANVEQKGTESSYGNERTTIEQTERSDAELDNAESIARIEEDTDRLALEVNPSKNGGSVSRKTGNGYLDRRRKPTTTLVSPANIPQSTLRRGATIGTTVSPKIELADASEGTEPYAKQTAAGNDQKTNVFDQSIRAQEFAMTVADPSSSSSDTGRTPLRDAVRRKISTTIAPRTYTTTHQAISSDDAGPRNRQRSSRVKNRPTMSATTGPRSNQGLLPIIIDYDYYEDQAPIIVGKSALNSKLFLTSNGTIRCLDQGNFPHPYSCKKFITCARMVNGQVIGTEYTCPDKLTFDPVGGICNWSAGLGCND